MARHGYRGDGAYGQFCVVLPEQDAVIATTGGTENMQGILDAVWTHLLPAMTAKDDRSVAGCHATECPTRWARVGGHRGRSRSEGFCGRVGRCLISAGGRGVPGSTKPYVRPDPHRDREDWQLTLRSVCRIQCKGRLRGWRTNLSDTDHGGRPGCRSP